MPYAWYEEVAANAPLMQGDLLIDCPIIRWSDNPAEQAQPLERLMVGEAVDCVVMSQACDLDQGHIRNVILCPIYPISSYKELWTSSVVATRQNPTEKSWKRFLDDVHEGMKWNLAMINSHDRSADGGLKSEVCVVDFHEIFSLPRIFLEIWVMNGGVARLRLLPPYREHLSQAFARYFMRVGLPENIAKAW